MYENILEVKDNKLKYNRQKYSIDDLFTLDFYRWADEHVSSYVSGEIFDNVIYINFVLNVMAIQYFILSNNVCKINIVSAERELVSYVIDAANLAGIEVEKKKHKKFFAERLKDECTFLAIACYLSFQQLSMKRITPTLDSSKDVCVIRTSAAKKKIQPSETREIFYENKICKGSLYSILSIWERFFFIRKAYSDAKIRHKKAKRILENYRLNESKHLIIKFLRLRLLPVSFYGLALDRLLSKGWKGSFVSGNNLDMYACIEEQVACKYGIKTICIPHGLEYGYRLPHVFTGDVFYTTSAYAASYLNKKYGTSKFQFNNDLVCSMFKLNNGKEINKKREVVFFTEPRESYINVRILKEMISILKTENIVLNLKHHPKDNLSEYLEIYQDVKIIDNLNEAIINNICIARKSTILLEALYNNGISAAIITNEKDNAVFHMFPSLSNPKILEFHDTKKLCEWIIMTIKE